MSKHGYLALISLLPIISAVGSSSCFDWKCAPPIGLMTGDLVFRRGQGMWTRYFIYVSSREKRFSHVGIVLDAKNFTLIHTDADERTGDGCVHTESWRSFFEDAVECAVFRFDGDSNIASNIAYNAERMIGRKFDSAFDMDETNKLYCSEMVRIVVNAAVKTNLVGFTKVCGRKVVAIDDLYRKDFIRVYDSKQSKK